LAADLGTPISDEKVDEALKDLDMNGDGVIDYKEFRRWYFSGMKPYRPGRKGLLKAG
jgi:Ca2+-binding EF-hand superfamily protein